MSEIQSDSFRLFRHEDVPEENSRDFQKLLHLTNRSSFEPKAYSWKDAPNRETWCAFGDNGTTALVGAYGDLIQFGAYTGRGQSGLFTADRKRSEEPYWVNQRTAQLMEWAEDAGPVEKHYGLQVYKALPDDWSRRILPPSELPELEWVNYRWPRFKTLGELEVTTQWLAHDGLILQQTRISYSGPDSVNLRFRVPSGEDTMDIRDLDHVDRSYPISVKYKQTLGPNQYSWIFTYELEPLEENGSDVDDSITVISSIMQDGKLVQWTAPLDSSTTGSKAETTTDENPSLVWNSSLSAEGNHCTEIVIAYKMVLVPLGPYPSWECFTISADSMDVSGILSEEPTSPDSLRLSDAHGNSYDVESPRSLPETPQASSDHIEFVVRRQLEHILSNCSIPLDPHTIERGSRKKRPSEASQEQSTGDEMVQIALTCGDMSFHRVSGSASFFSFTFLLEIHRRLLESSHSEDPYVRDISQRIRTVCRGHIHWILGAEVLVNKGFVANYWVNGKLIDGSDSDTWLAKDSLLDTAFQFIKVDDYAALDPEVATEAKYVMRGVVGNWMVDLKAKEHRKSFAWPHAFESLPSFRLDDHVWIWRALKAIEHPKILAYLQTLPSSKKSAKRFTQREVRRDILRHFTTKSDEISGKRMLAVARSCRETRFLLHARDTVLFHSLDWGFALDEPPVRELWVSTIQSQSRHDENHEEQWDNALRYTLAVLMGCREHSLNKRSPQDLLKSSLITLFESSSPNGLFAGQLNETTKKPICFFREQDRDFHFHCTFEIPYILLVNSSRVTEHRNDDNQKQQKHTPMVNTSPNQQYMENLSFDTGAGFAIISENTLGQLNPNQTSAGFPVTMVRPVGNPVVFKKRQPFYHLIDSTNIVEIEEEWLYNYPAFIKDTSLPNGSNANLLMVAYLLEGIDLREALKTTFSSSPRIVEEIVTNDEGLRRELCENLTDYAQERRRLLARIALPILRDEPLSQRSKDVKQLLNPVLEVYQKVAELKPEQIDAIYYTIPKVAEPTPGNLRAQEPSGSGGWWPPIRTRTSYAADAKLGEPTETSSASDDPGVPVLEELLIYHDLRERCRTALGRYIDVFLLAAEKIPELPERIATILDEDDNIMARVILKNRLLYEALRSKISKEVNNVSRIRQEIQRYADKLLHPEKPPRITSLQQNDVNNVRQPNEVPTSGCDTAASPLTEPVHRSSEERLPSEERPASNALPPSPATVPDEVNFGSHCGAFVVDTTKKVSQGRGQKAQGPISNEFFGRCISNTILWHKVLKIPRKPKKAKKRFIWLTEANPTTALVCFLGSPQVERDPMNLFFDRHSDYELFFFDDTTPHLNTWETELHISFYQILRDGESQPTGIPKPFKGSFLDNSSSKLTKASMGFRFFGDFFDRFWTCHFIEYLPSGGSGKVWDFPFDSSNSRYTVNGMWRQRKVLELYLFERIVDKVVSSTREIFDLVRTELGVSGEAFSMGALNSDDYFTFSEHWQKCQEALQVVEDQMEHIATEIAKWESRERSRGQENPRWTRRDERKYSGAIKKRLGACNSMVRDFRRLKVDITVRKQLLIGRQDQIRNDLSLNSAENIRFFTYVTVVFLPLGFAASIFSMSEVPDGQLIGSMAIVAAIALILTAVALATYGVSRKLPGLSKNTVRTSQLAHTNRKRVEQAGTEKSGDHVAATQIAKKKTIWYIGFWLTYVFVEKPLAYVALGFDAMDQPKWNWVTGFRIAVTIFLLPYCLFVCVVRVLAYNAMDLTRVVWDLLVSWLPAAPDPSDNRFRGVMGFLLNPDSKRMRPLKDKGRKGSKKQKREPDTRVPAEQPKFNQVDGVGQVPTEA